MPGEAAETGAPAVPADSCVYAIGDIHGRLDLLQALHGQILADAGGRRAGRKVAVYLGDYIDRGAQSGAVIDSLLDHPLPGFQSVFLMGNHEERLLAFLEDATVGPGWVRYGGGATLAGYGIEAPEVAAAPAVFEAVRRRLAACFPARHRGFLESLRPAHAEGDYFFAHAGVRPGIALERQQPDDLLWIRDDFRLSDAPFGKIVVHGHTITPEPDLRPNRIGIDTGAYRSGRLTCLVLEGSERTFLQTG